MSETTATQLLESIVASQRDIIRDVTPLFADDNWGQVRRLPNETQRDRIPARPRNSATGKRL